MKTAAEWIQTKTHLVNKNVVTSRFTKADIRRIQDDAHADGYRNGMLRASELCRDDILSFNTYYQQLILRSIEDKERMKAPNRKRSYETEDV